MYKEVSLYLDSIKAKTTKSQDFVSYFMHKGDTKVKPIKQMDPIKSIDMVYLQPNIKTLSEETLKKFSIFTQKIYKLACKIQELNATDIRALDRYMADYNYAHIRHMMEEYLGTLSSLDFDMLTYELELIDKKYLNQSEIIRIALESLKRFLDHQNFMYHNEEDDEDDN